MTTYITLDDVKARNGGELSQASSVVERWIAVAHNKLRNLEPALDDRVEAGTVDRDTLQDVLVESVWRRVQDDLIGWRVRSETWPENTTMFRDADKTGIYFLDDELADLGIDPEGPNAIRGAFSLYPVIRG